MDMALLKKPRDYNIMDDCHVVSKNDRKLETSV